MTLTYLVQNSTSDSVGLVMIRKFFQMIFVGNDRKSLHIYTASVLGGQKEELLEKTGKAKTKYVSELNDLSSFVVKFGFMITGNDNNDVISITSEDITNDHHGLLSQIDCIRRVWGEECAIISDNQSQLNEKLKRLLGEDPNYAVTAPLASRKLLWIEDKRKEHEGEMMALAISGGFSADDYPLNTDKSGEKKPEGSEQAFYRIQVPDNIELLKGIELVNWVKTTIRFKNKLRDSNLNYCIKKEMQANEGTIYVAPDFTWYFSPPAKSRISNESSIVEVVSKKTNCDMSCRYRDTLKQCASEPAQYDCECPIKEHFNSHHTTTSISNAINPVANKTTVNFTRWTQDEQINYRQKYRLASKNVMTQTSPFKDLSEINMFLDLSDEHGRGNRQFILSIFISFALAFGVDTTRLSNAEAYFPSWFILNADFFWLLLLVVLSLNLFIRPPRTQREQFFHLWREFNIYASTLWTLYVFIISKTPPCASLTALAAQYSISVFLVMKVFFGVFIISDSLYAIINIHTFHDPIVSGIFQDDIL